MTAAEIVAAVERAGGSLEAIAGERIRVHAPATTLSDDLKAAVIVCKPELLRFLGAVEKAGDLVRAARLLRECRWDPLPAPCAFHIGHTLEVCKRCGAPLAEHYG